MSTTGLVATYNYWVVALSVLVSVLAAYAAQDLSERVSVARGPPRAGWLAGAAVVAGLGIWSMHFTGMRALHLPIPVKYHWPTVWLSLLVGVIGCGVAELILSRGETGWRRVLAASFFMGVVAISGLHYTATWAMRLQAIDHHSPLLVILSVVLAILVSWMALSLRPVSRQDSPHRRLRNHGSALLMGAANPVMHYTAMAAITFVPGAVPDLSHTVSISSIDLFVFAIVPMMVLAVGMLTSLADRMQGQKTLLHELFEQAPQAVVVLSEDDRVVRVNREFSRLFGYTPEEALGRRLGELIVPGDSPDEAQRYRDLGARRERVETEAFRRRKDGSRLYVSIVRVPVLLPDGKFQIYGFDHDITGRLQAAQERQRLIEQLRALAARLQNAREEERARVAREIHDELGQALTAIKLDLASLIAELPPDRKPKPERAESIVKLADEAIRSVRRISTQLRPGVLDDLGLVAALEWAAEEFETRTRIKCRLDLPQDDLAIDRDRATALFRIFQETLTNVARHADATEVNLAVVYKLAFGARASYG